MTLLTRLWTMKEPDSETGRPTYFRNDEPLINLPMFPFLSWFANVKTFLLVVPLFDGRLKGFITPTPGRAESVSTVIIFRLV